MIEDSEELRIYIKMAKTRISSLYHDTAGACYLSFSGGKDSTVVLALIKECIEDGLIYSEIPAVYADTGIELQATKDFVEWVKNNYYSKVEIIKPEMSFLQIINKYGKPMISKLKSECLSFYQKDPNLKSGKYLYDDTVSKTDKARLSNKHMHFIHPDFNIKSSEKCCDYMKKKPFSKYTKENDIQGYYTGMRASEGGLRQMRYDKAIKEGKSPCTSIKGNLTIKSPIIDWTDEMCDEFIKKHNVPLSRAYTQYGCERTGCFLCPFGVNLEKDLKILFQEEPKQYKAAMAWMKDVYIAQNVVLKFDTEYERERERARGTTNILKCATKCLRNTGLIVNW